MKKILAVVVAILLLGASCALAAVPGKPDTFAYAYDFDAGVFSAADIEEISRYGAALEDATGIQVIAVAVDFLDGMDPADYATDLINTWGIGNKDNEGAVILLSRGDRQIQIGTGRGIDRVMTGSKCGELIDGRLGYFSDNRFAVGMTALYGDVCEYLAKAKGKTLEISAMTSDEEETLEVIVALIVFYFTACAILNSLFKGKKGCTGGCLRILFLGWLFDMNDAYDYGSSSYDDDTSDSSYDDGGSSGGFGGGESRGGGGGRSF